MSAPNDGGPAFPRPASETEEKGFHPGQLGMSLLDWFAGQALCSLAANFEEANDTAEIRAHYLAVRSYEIAEAMLAAREAGKEGA